MAVGWPIDESVVLPLTTAPRGSSTNRPGRTSICVPDRRTEVGPYVRAPSPRRGMKRQEKHDGHPLDPLPDRDAGRAGARTRTRHRSCDPPRRPDRASRCGALRGRYRPAPDRRGGCGGRDVAAGRDRPCAAVEPQHPERSTEPPAPAVRTSAGTDGLQPHVQQQPQLQQLVQPGSQPARRWSDHHQREVHVQHVPRPGDSVVRRAVEHELQQQPQRDEQPVRDVQPELQLVREPVGMPASGYRPRSRPR